MDKAQERLNIKCKCGKLWGLELFRKKRTCKRCKAIVKARGN
tara:strand:- start:392 stop:517 length:126 start_codon:yes stop_codon:yes gene_type:complete